MDRITKVMSISMITNIGLSMIKMFTGIIGKSGALIADGIHSFSDLSTDIVAVIGNHLSKKPADEKHPYGHGKIEYITSIMISIVILILGISIIYNAPKNEIVIPSLLVALISFITVIAKFILSKYIIKKGKEYKNNILLASGYESSTDVISSIVVFVSVLLMQLSNLCSVFKYADMVASILVGILIVKIGFDVLKENMSSILEEQETDKEYLNRLKMVILEKDGIDHIDHLSVLKYGSYYKLIAEVSVDSNLSIQTAHQYIHEAENRLKNFDQRIIYVTIHVNPNQKYKLVKARKCDVEKMMQYSFQTAIVKEPVDLEEKERILKEIKEKMNKYWKHYFMIEVDGNQVGMFGFHDIDRSILIEELFIEESYRYCGIGTSIVKNMMKDFKDKNIILWIDKANLSLLSLYEHLGFKKQAESETKLKLGTK